MLDPRFQTIADHLERTRCAMLANDEQLVLENLYHVRELAWEINADILASRWARRDKPLTNRIARNPLVGIDDLLA